MAYHVSPIHRWRFCLQAGLFLFLAGICGEGKSQTAVSVGSGAYATSIPAADQYLGGYYSMTAQQVVNYFTNLHIAPALTNRPIPSNKWWTDLLVADRSYQPTNGGPRVVQQDPFGGQLWSYPLMLAPNSSGFNLYFPNAWNARSNPNFPEGGFNAGPALPITGAIPLAVGTNDILIADFDGSNYPAGWVATGTAFGTGPIAGGTWPGEVPAVQGFLGAACVNSYRGADSPQGTLTSPAFTIQKHYIDVLCGGGSDTNNDAVTLLIGTNVVRAAAGTQSGTLTWKIWDVSAYAGQTAQIKIVDSTGNSWGFILCSWIVATDDGTDPSFRYSSTYHPTQSMVTGWSDWGVQFGLPDALGRRMDISMARGSPFVWTTYSNISPTIDAGGNTLYDTNGATISAISGSNFVASAFAFNDQGRVFGVFAPDNTVFNVAGTTLTAQFSGTNNYIVYGVLPSATNLAEFYGYAYAQVTNSQFDWTYDRAGGAVKTTWTVGLNPLKAGQTNTLQGWLPHHYRTTSNDLAFKNYSYLTPRGIMKVAPGAQFHVNFPFHGIAPNLPAPHLNNITNDYVASRMSNYVVTFAAAHPQPIADTYYGGKEMAITAQAIGFAQQLGMTNQVAQMLPAVRGELTNWFTYYPGKTNYFFARYTNWGALIGFPADFGSEAFNDNHFHYGYFAVATALVGLQDTNFIAQYGPMARMVAKEYANWDRTDTNFPFLRTFDIWEGHSWAGGVSSGAGENQESSSEAMNSWVGLFLLGNVMGDDAMTAAGAMGYANESTAVNEYWQDMYRTNFPASYGEGGVGILGSGGISYATYFDGDPAWIYGIQWVPANHWNNYLARDTNFANWQLTNMWQERVVASQYGINGFTLNDANNATAQGNYLGNYILGFQLLFDPNSVAAQIDSAFAINAAIATDNTYSGITYYLTHSLRGLGQPDTNYYTSLPTSAVYYNAATGIRTAVLYNTAATNQSVTLYNQGAAVATFTAPAGVLSMVTPGYTNRTALSVGLGEQINWPTVAGYSYQLQRSLNSNAWTSLTASFTGDGTTNSFFDTNGNLRFYYRVLEVTTPSSGSPSVISNGGFESGNGATATSWSVGGSQPALRNGTVAHNGTYSMDFTVTNSGTVPNTASVSQKASGQIIAGQSYNFSFWARQVSAGVSYVQNYRLSWLDINSATLGSPQYTGFSASAGVWSQTALTNQTAPANTVSVQVDIYTATGAVSGAAGETLVDDVLLALNTPGQTNVISPKASLATRLQWLSASGETYQAQASTNLLPSSGWTNFGTAVSGDGGIKSLVDTNSLNNSKFYRLQQVP